MRVKRTLLAFAVLICALIGILCLVQAKCASTPSQMPVFKRSMPVELLQNVMDEALKRDIAFQWKMPISFYGKVVDEHGTPVGGVEIRFIWNDLSRNGTSERRVHSDALGLFSLSGIRGKRLGVELHKEGFYTSSRRNQYDFDYGNPFEPVFHEPDASRPVVFVVRKRGIAEPMVCRYFQFQVSRHGQATRADLLQGKVSPEGPLEVRRWRSGEVAQKRDFDWKASLCIDDGGFVETDEEFPFTAPDQGYKKSIEFSMSKSDGKEWLPSWETHCYAKFGQPPTYCFLRVRLYGGSKDVYVECYVNPSGSRNLEYDEDRDITKQFNK